MRINHEANNQNQNSYCFFGRIGDSGQISWLGQVAVPARWENLQTYPINKWVDMSTREHHRYRWWIGRGSRTTLSACVMVAFLRVRVHRMLLRVAFVTNWSSNWRHYILIARTQMNSSIITKQCGMNAEDTRNWEVKFVHSQNESGSYKSCIPPGCMLEHTFFEDWTVLAAMLLANMLTNNSPRAMSRGMGSQGPGDGCD